MPPLVPRPIQPMLCVRGYQDEPVLYKGIGGIDSIEGTSIRLIAELYFE